MGCWRLGVEAADAECTRGQIGLCGALTSRIAKPEALSDGRFVCAARQASLHAKQAAGEKRDSRTCRARTQKLVGAQKLVRMRSLGTPLPVSSSVMAPAMSFCPHSTAATPVQSEMPLSCGGREWVGGWKAGGGWPVSAATGWPLRAGDLEEMPSAWLWET